MSRFILYVFVAIATATFLTTQTHAAQVVFAVKSTNMDYLESALLSVSDPKSPYYGQHMNLQQISKYFVDHSARQKLINYLDDFQGLQIDVTLAGDFVKVTGPDYVIESLIPGAWAARAGIQSAIVSPTREMEEFVDFIALQRPVSPPRKSLIQLQSSFDNLVTPELFMKHYGISSNVVQSTKATQAVFESLNQSFSPADLDQYLSEFDLKSQRIVDIIGPNNPEDCFVHGGENCGEANLDVQIILALAQDSPTTYWSVPASGSSQFEPFLEWILAVSNTTEPPLVHSVSYGDVEVDLDATMMKRFSTEVQKLGLRGITVIVSSGDDGVGNYNVRQGIEYCGYNPSFPASDPYVTTVGATQGPEVGESEVSCSSETGGIITSGGGFSDIFLQPSYQTSAVSTFLETTSVVGDYNEQGRGYPDVSLLGHDYAIVLGGKPASESGTSASAPAFAALVTLVNGERLAQGKSPLGFLNPVLYAHPELFYDIEAGENNCAAGHNDVVCCEEGFFAIKGWDPVTGLGSVNFSNFREVLVSL